jgi:hypothetical protein
LGIGKGNKMDDETMKNLADHVIESLNNLSSTDRTKLMIIEATYASNKAAKQLIDLLMTIMAASFMKKSVMLEVFDKLLSILDAVERSNNREGN